MKTNKHDFLMLAIKIISSWLMFCKLSSLTEHCLSPAKGRKVFAVTRTGLLTTIYLPRRVRSDQQQDLAYYIPQFAAIVINPGNVFMFFICVNFAIFVKWNKNCSNLRMQSTFLPPHFRKSILAQIIFNKPCISQEFFASAQRDSATIWAKEFPQ